MPGNLDLALRIRADLANAERGLRQLDRRIDAVGASGRKARGSLARVANEVDRVDASAGRASERLRRLLTGLLPVGGPLAIIAAVRVVGDLVRGVAEAGIEIERLESRFRFATGSIAAGARELAFVREEANRIGIDFVAAADAYSGLAAAAKGTNLSLNDTREIFLGVAEAARVMGLDAEQTRGALLALEQILSKGKVSAEELRGQLGERLPGAFQIAARAMGVATAELDKMLVSGELLAEEFLPRFARELRATVAEDVPEAARTAQAEFARLGNAIEDLEASIAKSGLLSFLTEAARLVTEILERVARARDTGSLRDDLERNLEIRQTQIPDPDSEAGRAIHARLSEELEASNRALSQLSDEQIALLARIRNESTGALAALANEFIAASINARALRAETETSDEAPAGDSAAEKAAEKAAKRLAAIARRADDARLRSQGDRIALSLLQEARLIEEIQGLVDKGIASAEAAEAAKTAVRARGVAERLALEARAAKAQSDRERAAAREAAREHKARVRATSRAREELVRLNRELLGPYDRAVAEIRAWEAETVNAFKRAGLSAEKYGRTVAETVSRRLAEAAREEADRRLEASDDWRDGALRALREYSVASVNAAARAEEAVTSGLKSMEDALVQFVTTGKLEFSDLANSIIADLARIAIRQSITQPLAGGLLGFLGRLFGGGAPQSSFPFINPPTAHSGGVAGELIRHRTGIDPRAFAFAPRLHSGGVAGGLRPGEIPTILRRGEGVFTPEQMRALGGGLAGPRELRVELVNRGRSQQELVEASATFDIRGEVVRIVTQDIADGGQVARSIQSIVPGTVL